jgi:hypothetical protein
VDAAVQIARFCAAGEVTLILWGRAFAQFPYLVVPDITIYAGSAPQVTIKSLAAAPLVGAALLLPSYRYLLIVFKSRNRRQFAYSNNHTNAQPQVVILGGGFGGLAAARALSREPVRITLIDRRNHHLFQPLLHQVATAALAPSEIALPIRRIMRGRPHVSVILDEATSIDVAGKKVILRDGEVEYDYLLVATGATHSYFGHDAWRRLRRGSKLWKTRLRFAEECSSPMRQQKSRTTWRRNAVG